MPHKKNRVNPVGISSHINWLSEADIDKQLTLMQQAGINWIRFDFPWQQFEAVQGTWDFSIFDYILNGATSRGMKVLALMAQYNAPAWYLGTNPWNYPIDPTSYGKFVSTVATHFKGKILLYEMGNEPNIDLFWFPQSNPAAYTAILKAGYQAVKLADPNAKVMTAGLANVTPNIYLQSMYGNGAKGYFDYLAFHPYSWPNAPYFGELDVLRNIMAQNNDTKPIMITEVGSPSTIASGGVDEATQATYTNQFYQMVEYGNYQYVPIVCIYDFLDDGTDQANPEDNFGILRTDYSEKPSFATMQSVRSDYNSRFIPINP